MEVQMAAAARGARRPAGQRSAPPSPDHHAGHHSGGASAKPVPRYLRPSPGSCHHVCKYGGAHAFGEEEKDQPRGRAQPPPRPRRAPAALESQQSSRVLLGKVRSVFRRRAGDSGAARADQKGSKAAAAAGTAKASGGGSVEWKDIVVVAYGRVPVPRHGSSPEEQQDKVTGAGDAKKKDAVKAKKKAYVKAKVTGQQVNGVKTMSASTDAKSVKKPAPKVMKPSALLVEKMMAAVDDQETLHGSSYQTLSPSLVQSRADLLRELDEEMAHEAAANVKPERTACSADQEDYAAVESSRPVPAHRRAKSMMGIGGSRSVRFPFARQASKSSSGASFKVRSRSTRAVPALEEERPAPARERSRRGDQDASGGRGIQLRIRSLRRRGVGGGRSGGSGTGFVVPAVALRHQKTLEKKKSQRLYNNLIEETAGKLVKARKSRVKALVGAFESVISKIAK